VSNILREDGKKMAHLVDGAGGEGESVSVEVVSERSRTSDHDVHVGRLTVIV